MSHTSDRRAAWEKFDQEQRQIRKKRNDDFKVIWEASLSDARRKREASSGSSKPIQKVEHERACDILGLRYNYGPQELQKAYHRAMRAHHPDLTSDPQANEKAQLCNWAYEYLRR
jgi:DnaJ-class molecular chaperone